MNIHILIDGTPGSGNCIGPEAETTVCNTQPCPMWGGWSSSDCSMTCGPGVILRQRECLNGEPSDCPGMGSEVESCNIEVRIVIYIPSKSSFQTFCLNLLMFFKI